MKISRSAIAAIFLASLFGTQANATEAPKQITVEANSSIADPRLYGVWIPKTYIYDGKPHPMDSGLMVITPNFLIANAIYDLSEPRKTEPDANANYGPYRITAPGVLVMQQQMQLHWRGPGGEKLVEGDGTFFHRGVPETIHYEVNGDKLTLRFQVPGEQAWVLERANGETCTPSAGK
jgi:hypothetical protein